jgi:hypothetical protein
VVNSIFLEFDYRQNRVLGSLYCVRRDAEERESGDTIDRVERKVHHLEESKVKHSNENRVQRVQHKFQSQP